MDLNFSKSKKIDYLFIGVSILCFILHLYKARYTLGSSDEHFYITEGYRLLQGDRLFFDNLFIGQSFGLFVMPFVGLYRSIVGSNDGIVLYMRIIYIMIHILVGILFYYRFHKEYDQRKVFLASILYYVYTPFNIMALSYNTMSIDFLLLALMCYPWKKESIVYSFLAGILYGCAVLNAPLLALGYFILLFYLIKSKNMNGKNYLFFSIGIGVIALSFLFFVFSRITWNEFTSSFQLLFDPSHSGGILFNTIKNGGRLIVHFHIGFLGLLVLLLLPLFSFKKEKKEMTMKVLYGIVCLSILWVGFIHPTENDLGGFSKVLIPFALLGFGEILFYENPYELKVFYWVSIFHAFVVSMSSNVGPDSFSCPLIVACMSTILMMKDEDKVYAHALCIFLIIVLAYFKIFNYYQGSRNFEMNTNVGPCKGLMDSKEVITKYEETFDDIKAIGEKEGESLLCISNESWPYLVTSKRVGSGWSYLMFWQEEDFINYEETYMELHPNLKPYIYLDPDNHYEMTKDNEWLQGHTFIEEMRYGILYKW